MSGSNLGSLRYLLVPRYNSAFHALSARFTVGLTAAKARGRISKKQVRFGLQC